MRNQSGLLHLWIVSEFYYPDENATGYLLTQLAEGLAKDFQIQVVTCRSGSVGQSGKGPERHNDVSIVRSPVPHLDRTNILLRLVRDLLTTISLSVSLFRRISADDTVLVVTNPPALPGVVRLVAKFKDAKYVILAYDVYPEVIIAAGLINQNSWMATMLRSFSRKAFQGAAMVVALGWDMKELLKKTYGVEESRIRVIHNWGETKTIIPSSPLRDSTLKQVGLERKFVVQYVGNIGRTHNLEILVEAAAQLTRRPDIAFFVIGDGVKANWLRAQIADRGLTNIVFLPFFPRTRQAEAHAAGDIAFVSFITQMNGVSVPSRMYNMMAAGKPMLAVTSPDSELARVIEEEQIGWVITSGDAQDVVRVIEEASVNHNILSVMAGRARAAVEKKYSPEVVIPKFRAMFLEMA